MKRKFWIAALAACMSVTALFAFTACDLGLGGKDDDKKDNNNNDNDPVIDNSDVTSQQITEEQWIAAYNPEYFTNVTVSATQSMTEGSNKQQSTIVSKAAGGNGYAVITNGSGASAVKVEHYYDGETGQSYRLNGSVWVAESDSDFYPSALFEQMAAFKNSYAAFKYDSEAGSYVVDATTTEGAQIATYAPNLTLKYSDGKLVYMASRVESQNRVTEFIYNMAYGNTTVTKPEGIGENQGGSGDTDVPDIDNSNVTSEQVTEEQWTEAFGATYLTNVVVVASSTGIDNSGSDVEQTLVSKAGGGNEYAHITTKVSGKGGTSASEETYFYYGKNSKSYRFEKGAWQENDFMHNYPSALENDVFSMFIDSYSAFMYDSKNGSYVVNPKTEAGAAIAQSMGEVSLKFSDGKIVYISIHMEREKAVMDSVYNFAYGNVTVSVPSNFNPESSGGEGGQTQQPAQSIVGYTYACVGVAVRYEPAEGEKPALNKMYSDYEASTIMILNEKEAQLRVDGEAYIGTYTREGESITFRFEIGDSREIFEGVLPWAERLELSVQFTGGALPGLSMTLYYESK